jgi:gamma-glutamylputrescine oxidase
MTPVSIAADRMTSPVWHDDPAPARAPLDGDLSCDVVVIGAGIGGLATAWHLLGHGIRAVVVERRTVAAGASGRNGGFFIAGLAPMYDHAVRELGRERAARAYRVTLEAQEEMLAVAEEVGAREHFRITGLLRLGMDAVEAEAVRKHQAALAADGFPGVLVTPEELPSPLRRPERLALCTPHDGTVHPVRWLRALAAALERRGVRIVEATAVTAPPHAGDRGVVVTTDRGAIHAGHAVVAVDGGLESLVTGTAVRCRRLNMLATAPAPAGALPRPVYARDGHEYAQQLADGRIALGGFSDLDDGSYTDREELSVAVQERLTRYLREELGVGAPVTHRWVGVVGYAEDPMPRCGPVPGTDGRVLALGGYNGTGHIQAWVAAGEIAAHAAGTPAASLYAAI